MAKVTPYHENTYKNVKQFVCLAVKNSFSDITDADASAALNHFHERRSPIFITKRRGRHVFHTVVAHYLRFLGSKCGCRFISEASIRAPLRFRRIHQGNHRRHRTVARLPDAGESARFDQLFRKLAWVRGFGGPHPVNIPRPSRLVPALRQRLSLTPSTHPKGADSNLGILVSRRHAALLYRVRMRLERRPITINGSRTRAPAQAYLTRNDNPLSTTRWPILHDLRMPIIAGCWGPRSQPLSLWTDGRHVPSHGRGCRRTFRKGLYWSTYPERLEKRASRGNLSDLKRLRIGRRDSGLDSDPYIGNYGRQFAALFPSYQTPFRVQPL